MKYRTDQTATENWQYYQKKLVPANIVIALIALVACVSMFFGSIFSVKINLSADFFAAMSDSVGGGQGENPSDGSLEEMQFMMQGVDCDMGISLSTFQVLKIATAKDTSALRAAYDQSVSEMTSVMDTLFRQMLPNAVGQIVIEAAGGVAADKELADYDVSGFQKIITDLAEDAPDVTAIKTEFLALCQNFALNEMQIALTPEQLNDAATAYDNIIENGTDESGAFSMKTLIETGMESVSGGEGESSNPFDQMELSDEQLVYVKYVAYAIGGIVGVGLLVWGFLLLLSVIHIFTRNKKVAMWYVKLFGLLPCLVFFLLPMAVVKLVPLFVTEPGISALSLISFGGMSVVSGICLLALWIVSIFWCHPIKKRIERARKEMLTAASYR